MPIQHIDHDLTVTKPDYHGGSIINLMSSLGTALGAPPSSYAPLTGLAVDRLRAARRIVLVVIDGLGAELLAHIGNGSMLAALKSGTMTSVYPPTTASAITTFMSGLAPQQHGLTGWFMHFRKLGAVAAVLPFVPRYGRGSIAESGVAMDALIDVPSFFDRIDAPAVALLPAGIADSDFSRLLGGRARRVPYSTLADFATQLGAYCNGAHTARYVYAYWSELDHLAHKYGPSSPAVADHFNELDAVLGPLAAACRDNGTLLIVTADHGFIDTSDDERLELDEHPALADLLTLPLCGEPRTAYCYVRQRGAAAFEDYVKSEWADHADLIPSASLIADGWFGLGAAHRELNARIGDYTLQMRGRYTIRDHVAGERGFRLLGVHGGVTAAEQYVPLILAGP